MSEQWDNNNSDMPNNTVNNSDISNENQESQDIAQENQNTQNIAQETQDIIQETQNTIQENPNTQSIQDTVQEAPKQQYDYYQYSNQEANKQESNMNFMNQSQEPRERNHSNMAKRWGVLLGMAVAFGCVAGATMFGVNAVANKLSGTGSSSKQVESTKIAGEGNTTTVEQTTPAQSSEDSSSEASSTAASAQGQSGTYTVAQVAENTMPAIVSITNKSVQEVQNWFGGQTQQYESESSGSGIIVGQNDTELLIATNNHVVSGANTLSVAFIDENVVEAQIKGTDADNDLAVISVKTENIPEETLNAIKIIQIGSSDDLVVGEQVVAIGNALGYGQSLTVGYVSALNRQITTSSASASGPSLIQTDAAINPGNSGGALLNMNGELVGINSAKFSSTEVEGMCFAIPVSTAEPILDELMNRETKYKVSDADAAYLGITCKNVSSDTAQMYNMPQGIYIASVTDNGPSQSAGIQKGDIITAMGGTSVTTYDELVEELSYYAAGEDIDVVLSRANNGEYQEMTVTVTLGNKADMPETTTDSSDSSNNSGNSSSSNSGSNIPSIQDLLP